METQFDPVSIERGVTHDVDTLVAERSVADFAAFATRARWHARAVEMGLLEETHASEEERAERARMLQSMKEARAGYYGAHKEIAMDASRDFDERVSAVGICASVVGATTADLPLIDSPDEIESAVRRLDDWFASGLPERRKHREIATDAAALTSHPSALVRSLATGDNLELALALDAFADERATVATFAAWLAESNVAWHAEAVRLSRQ